MRRLIQSEFKKIFKSKINIVLLLILFIFNGFVRLVTDENGTVIGGQVAGAGASDLISELTVAVEGGLNAEDLALTIHPHPTLSETIMDDAEVALGLPINI